MEFKFEDMPIVIQNRLIRERLVKLAESDDILRTMLSIQRDCYPNMMHLPTTRVIAREHYPQTLLSE